MTFGLKTYNRKGDTSLDTDRVLRLRYFTKAELDTSGSVYLPDIKGLKSLEFGLCLITPFGFPHIVYRDDDTLYWDLSGESVTHETFVYMFLYT